MLNLRNTPVQSTNLSPSQQFLNRRTRTLLPTRSTQLKPRTPDPINLMEKQARQQQRSQKYYNKHAKDLPILEQDDVVRIKPISNSITKQPWKKGIVHKRLDERSYEVECDDRVLRRNRVHLRKTNEQINVTTPKRIIPSVTPVPTPPKPCTKSPDQISTPKKVTFSPTVMNTPMIKVNSPPKPPLQQMDSQLYQTRSGRVSIPPKKLNL